MKRSWFKRLGVTNTFTDFKHHHESWRNSKKLRARSDRSRMKRDLAVDTIEVIRCEDCRRRDDNWEDWEDGKVLYWCDMLEGRVNADDYCSYGVLRNCK